MPDVAGLPFHLLRPLWLAALVPVAAVLTLVLRRQSPEAQWGGVIARHLLKSLIVRPGRRWSINPAWLVASSLVLAIVGLSGPTWKRELPPFVEDKAPLMIALALSSSMGETDVAPSRLERAKQKIRDLLATRSGARTGLIAFAGTAHLVMPLTDDRAVIAPFLAALAPGLMPQDGKNAAAAIALATQSLATEPVAGTVLLVADDLDSSVSNALRQAAGRSNLLMLAVRPPQAVDPAAPIARSDIVSVSVDGADIRALERNALPGGTERCVRRAMAG
jgi:Ca-activated chloride channel homolog